MSENKGDKMVLFLVHSIEVDEQENIKESSGEVIFKHPWKINKQKLTPIKYTYTMS